MMKKHLVTLLGVTVCSALAGSIPEAMAYVSLKCDGKHALRSSTGFTPILMKILP